MADGMVNIEQVARLAGVSLDAGTGQVPVEWLDYSFVNKCTDG